MSLTISLEWFIKLMPIVTAFGLIIVHLIAVIFWIWLLSTLFYICVRCCRLINTNKEEDLWEGSKMIGVIIGLITYGFIILPLFIKIFLIC